MVLYHELREASPQAARLLVRKALEQQKGNFSKTARVLAVRPLYDYEGLLPFSELQGDTKYILDQDSLPTDVYEHIKARTVLDVATRARFLALSYELSSYFGAVFLTLVLCWLRAHEVRWPDEGPEVAGHVELLQAPLWPWDEG